MTTLAQYAASRELLTNLTLRELRGKYKRSALGWAWSLLNPLATMVIFTLVFRFFLRVQPPVGDPSGLHNFAVFLLCGLLPWTFMTNATVGSIGALVANANLIKKTYFPRELLIGAQVASFVVSFLLELVLVLVVLLAVGKVVFLYVPAVLYLVVILALFSAGLGLAVSVLNVYFRDIQHLIGIVFQAWLYLTPVVYPISIVENAEAELFGRTVPVMTIYRLNPMVGFVEAFRDCLYDGRFPGLATVAGLTAVSVVTFAAGLMVFRRLEGRLAEEL